MKKRQIVNLVNFVRACEPREPVDLYKPVYEELALMKRHRLRGTFLLQYDTMLDPAFVSLFRDLDPAQFELGVWHEIVQPETEACGIPWTGRYPWDWHVHCGFPAGYTKPQREQLVDALFEKFRELFGYYPRVIGSWLPDSHTIRYLSDKYGLDAVCFCKEQYGTDGYTLWGGYYGQAYYPSRTNYFMPAQTEAERLPVPVFRMLGSDPVYQYDFGMDTERGADTCQGVVTLEPVYTGIGGGGGVPSWVDWFLKENFNGDCLSFGYAQAGQENPFGWERIGPGLTYQCERIAALQAEGALEVIPLGETGRWFRDTYPTTPASAITAHTAYDDPEKNSVWYSNRFFRANVYCDHGTFRIRDIHIFDERYPDPFETAVCEANEGTYDTLPLVDGNRYSGGGCLAGLYIRDMASGDAIPGGALTFRETEDGAAAVLCGGIETVLSETGITVRCPGRSGEFLLENRIGKQSDHLPAVISRTENTLLLSYRGTQYRVCLRTGVFTDDRTVRSVNGTVCAEFSVC